MSSDKINEAKLKKMAFFNRENDIRHVSYDKDMEKFELLKAGDPRGIQLNDEAFGIKKALEGTLSDNPLRSIKYQFVACVTLACRFAMDAGMDAETSYNASDLFIRKADKLETLEQVQALANEAFTFYTNYVANLHKRKINSLHVVKCEDYIIQHLHDDISLASLSEFTGLNASYLSKLFKNETGMSITDYITNRKIEAAKNMLKYSDYPISIISNYLNFNTQSYFNRVFKKCTGLTPNEYRTKYFRTSFNSD